MYMVVWADEDGMDYALFSSRGQARKKLKMLYESVAPEEYQEENLEYYADEWEPEGNDPCSEENEMGHLMRQRYNKIRSMSLEEDDIALTDEYLYYRETTRLLPQAMKKLFNARIIPLGEAG